MPVEPPRKIYDTPPVRREEKTGNQQKKKPKPQKPEPDENRNTPGKVDIKV